MRLLCLGLFLIFAVCGLSRAQDATQGSIPSAADQEAIHGVISGQIQAFRRDDAGAAFGYAAPSLQELFGTADHFMAMVRRGYQPVYRPRSVDFAGIVADGDQWVQQVELTGPDGLPYTARYTMEHEADGSWRITACDLVESRRTGV
jgi:hypothetical protein